MKINNLIFKKFIFLPGAVFFTALFLNGNLSAQDINLPDKNSESKVNSLKAKYPIRTKTENIPLTQTKENIATQDAQSINDQILQLKQPGDAAKNGDRILDLQKELEKINGSTVTKSGTNNFGTFIPALNHQETDNLSYSYVLKYANNYVASIAAQVEQRGATAGKIWLAVGLANGDTGVFAIPDSIGIYYSNDNGLSYIPYAKIAFSGHNKIEFDNMDMELIENTTGTKYLHIVFGYTTNGGYGQHLIGYTIVSVPTLGYAGSTLFPPGYNSSSFYTKARITSDNTRYGSNPYITIAITQDSLSGGDHYFMSKVCRVLSPYSLAPAVTYLPKCIYGVAPGHNYDVFTDVANYHNGSDSLLFVLSAYPGYEQSLYFYKAFSNSVVYPVSSGSVNPTSDNLQYARVAANAGTDQKRIMITYSDDYLNTGDLDQWILSTDDASNWYASTLDYTSLNKSRFGDIIGRRNASGSFAVTFKNIYGNLENVASYGFTDMSLTSSLPSLNNDFANSLASPKPLFKFQNNDSCLNIWSYYYSVSSTGGCSVSNLYVKAGIEGYYDDVTDSHINYAAMYVLLADANPPYNIVDTGYVYLENERLSNVIAFPRALTGDYYLIMKHYNCLETWSAAPVHIEPENIGSYDFTTSDAQAYGNNMMLKGAKWCIYSGDVDQDGTIDLADVVFVYNDVVNFVVGNITISDLNGDYFTDLSDLLIAFNNSVNFVAKITPP